MCVCTGLIHLKLEHIVVYENNSNEFNIGHCNNLQDLLISSRLNDLTNCQRRFNVDIMMLYISGRDHARKLKFSSYVHPPSINNMFQYCYA